MVAVVQLWPLHSCRDCSWSGGTSWDFFILGLGQVLGQS